MLHVLHECIIMHDMIENTINEFKIIINCFQLTASSILSYVVFILNYFFTFHLWVKNITFKQYISTTSLFLQTEILNG